MLGSICSHEVRHVRGPLLAQRHWSTLAPLVLVCLGLGNFGHVSSTNVTRRLPSATDEALIIRK